LFASKYKWDSNDQSYRRTIKFGNALGDDRQCDYKKVVTPDEVLSYWMEGFHEVIASDKCSGESYGRGPKIG
jgi:hypothetical protein